MKITKFVFAFVLLIIVAKPSSTVPNEHIWISFVSNRSFAKYIMQIDVLGNVLLPPVRISELGAFRRAGVNALSLNGTKALNFWYTPLRIEKGNISFTGQIFRIVLDKTSLKTLRIAKTSLYQLGGTGGIGSPLSVTKRTKDNFISFAVKTDEGMRVAAYPLNKFGQVTGKRWFISPPFPQSCNDDTSRCKGGTVSSGRLTYWIAEDPSSGRRTDLFVRPLGAFGHPVLETVKIDDIFAQTLASPWTFNAVDATGLLPGSKRFLVYIKAPALGTFPQKLILQLIDARTGKKAADRIVLQSGPQLSSAVKIDPGGGFVLFANSELLYLALDATGHASGHPKVLTGLDAGYIDLLRENLK